MSLRIVAFEDVAHDYEELCRVFGASSAEFRHFNLDSDQETLEQRCDEIAGFSPSFILVDLIKDFATSDELPDPGMRIIRYLLDSELTRGYPVIAYSKALRDNTVSGRRMIDTIQECGAKTLLKTIGGDGRITVSPERFLELAGVQPTE